MHDREVIHTVRDLRSRAKALRQGGEFCAACERGMVDEGERDAGVMERAAKLIDSLEIALELAEKREREDSADG